MGDWENRTPELKDFLKQGRIPFLEELNDGKQGWSQFYPALMGQAAGAIKEVKTADEIVQEMMKDALGTLKSSNQFISRLSVCCHKCTLHLVQAQTDFCSGTGF